VHVEWIHSRTFVGSSLVRRGEREAEWMESIEVEDWFQVDRSGGSLLGII